MSRLLNLEPREVWARFDEITRVPRPSKREAKIIAYLTGFARQHGFDCEQDSTGNVVIRCGATPGMEDRPTVVLQSHMDMVCEKNGDVVFDFDNASIRTRIEEGWVRAEGTTLGADCGIGMAAELAVLTAPGVEHGPLECLFTTDEETGLTGAFGLGRNMLSGKYLINLDSEDEGEIFIGCAGGIDTVGILRYAPQQAPDNYVYFRADVSGLTGGHSGDDIEKGRGNSNKLLNRFLRDTAEKLELRLGWFDGGNLRNAIPREAFAVFGVPMRDGDLLCQAFDLFRSQIENEYRITEPGLKLSLTEMPAPETVMDEQSQQALLDALCGVPNGVLSMSRSMPGLVETSTNLASVKFTAENSVVLTTSQRSSIESARNEAAAAVASVFRLAGAEVSHSDGYPGWNPDPGSHLLEVTRSAYRELFGTDPKVRAIHAGLECGLFLEKYPWLEMVSFGPTLRGVHSPDERLEIATVDKFWKLLTTVLRILK